MSTLRAGTNQTSSLENLVWQGQSQLQNPSMQILAPGQSMLSVGSHSLPRLLFDPQTWYDPVLVVTLLQSGNEGKPAQSLGIEQAM